MGISPGNIFGSRPPSLPELSATLDADVKVPVKVWW